MISRPLIGLIFGLTISHAQVPDVSIVTDVRSTFQFSDGDVSGRLYDPFGRMSTVTLQLIFEGFYIVRVSERFAKIRGDNIGKQLEYAYFEYPGLWRIGYIPARFGADWLIREYGLGGEIRTNLVFDNLPIIVGVIDDGERRPSGVLARVGGKIGFSYANGNHFGASGTSLTAVRRPESAPGAGRGYRSLYGVDVSGRLGLWSGRIEAVALRQGHTSGDRDEDIVDFQIGYQKSSTDPDLKLGYARTLKGKTDHVRFEAEQKISRELSLTGQMRLDAGRRLIAVGLRARF